MRLYLDTNILAFLLLGNYDDISSDVLALFRDEETINLTSVVCVDELIHLCQIGKIPISKRSPIKSPTDVTSWLESIGVQIVEVERKHLDEVASLFLYEDHRDPNDRLIIAQAISDRIPLVSSDRKFERYEKFGLGFIFNER